MPTTRTLKKSPFLSAIKRSGLIPNEQIDSFLAEHDPMGSHQSDPIKLAGLFVRKKALTKFQAMNLLNGKTAGFRMGQYTVLDGIRQDRVGMVFLAEKGLGGKRYGLKILPTDRTSDPTILEDFQREVRKAAQVDHAHVARVLDLDEWNGTMFVVVEHVPGPTLDKLVAEKGPLAPNVAAQYIAQAATALKFAHEKDLIHRDIKPGNLALTKSGIKLIDLGLTHMLENPWARVTKRISTKEFAEEIDHIAPEQAWGSALDGRSDIYSLGSTFYYLITGQSPFPGTAAEKMAARQVRGVPKPSLVNKDVPPELDAIIEKMTARDPHERYQSAGEVVAALMPWLPVSQWVALGVNVSPAAKAPSVMNPVTVDVSAKKDNSKTILVGILVAAVVLVAGLAAAFM
jgi:serine/threonine-protein kinase